MCAAVNAASVFGLRGLGALDLFSEFLGLLQQGGLLVRCGLAHRLAGRLLLGTVIGQITAARRAVSAAKSASTSAGLSPRARCDARRRRRLAQQPEVDHGRYL